MELSIKYQYCWLWRFFIEWDGKSLEICLYDKERNSEQHRVTILWR